MGDAREPSFLSPRGITPFTCKEIREMRNERWDLAEEERLG